MDKTQLKAFVTQHLKHIGFGFLGLIIIGYLMYDQTHQAPPTTDSQLPQLMVTKPTTAETQETSSQTTTVIVDIKGAVHQPGVYEVEANLRVTDVIEIAGGLRPDADQNQINLAQKIADEQVIYVAVIGETAPTTTQLQPSATTTTTNKINLNTATIDELQTLSGIGAKKAQDVIDYREANGPFSTVDALADVSGFGEKTIDRLRDAVTVD
jgi:competence protein ComEA